MNAVTPWHGDFINLRAFRDCEDLRQPGARLPNWQTIQTHYPELIDSSANPDRWFVSHRWDDLGGDYDTAPHPDPSGWQLEALLQLADHYNWNKPNLCIWYDYMSLPQKPRSAAERDLFQQGLQNIRHLVAECQNVFLVSASGHDAQSDLDEHLRRGWIVFELYIARSNIRIPLAVRQRHAGRIDEARASYDWDATVPNIQAIAPWEDAGQLETWFRNRGIVCTNGADLAFLARELHDSLGLCPFTGPIRPVNPSGPTILTTSEITQFGFINGSGLSPRRPDLFLEGSDFDPRTHIWAARIQSRPKAWPLGAWISIAPDDLAERLIDPVTGRSPMYPGIRFKITPDGGRVRAVIE